MIQIAMIVCAAVLVVAVGATVSGFFNGNVFGYADAEKYTAGEADINATVNNLDINWTNGKVILEYHGGSTVELRESSAQTISGDMQLRWRMDGDTLRVQYAKSGFRLNWNQEKELTVRLPEGSAFHNVKISATSGELSIPALKAEVLTLSATSGAIHAAAEAGQVNADATSGSLNLQLSGSAEAVQAHTTSGALSVEANVVGTLKASSTSGSLRLDAERATGCEADTTSGAVTVRLNEAEQVKIGSTSGDVTVRLAKFSSLQANTTSGRINAGLSEQPGFTARIATVSGRIDYDLPLSHPKDQTGNAYVCGDGSARVELGTTSGNIALNRLDRETAVEPGK